MGVPVAGKLWVTPVDGDFTMDADGQLKRGGCRLCGVQDHQKRPVRDDFKQCLSRLNLLLGRDCWTVGAVRAGIPGRWCDVGTRWITLAEV